MSATTAVRQPATLRRALGDMLGGVDVPEQAPPTWIAKTFGIDYGTVYSAITSGKLPAETIVGNSGRVLQYTVNPADALLIWGWRLFQTNSTTEKAANNP